MRASASPGCWANYVGQARGILGNDILNTPRIYGSATDVRRTASIRCRAFRKLLRQFQYFERAAAVQHDPVCVDGMQGSSGRYRVANEIDFFFIAIVRNDCNRGFRVGVGDGALQGQA